MDKKILNNAVVLAAILLGMNAAVAAAMLAIAAILRIDSGFATIAGILGALLLGNLYAATFRQEMPKALKAKVVIIAVAAQMILAFAYMIALIPAADYAFFAVVIVVASLVYGAATYFMITLGGKDVLKKRNKK